MQFQVQIPLAHNLKQQESLTIDAPNWLVALRNGLKQLGDPTEMRNISCDIVGDNDVRVTDTKSGRTFEIREMRDGAVLAPAALAPAAVATPAPAPSLPPLANNKTEAFIPPKDFFESMQSTINEAQSSPAPAGTIASVASVPASLAPLSIPSPASTPSPGQPVQVSPPTKPPVTKRPITDDAPFEVNAPSRSSEELLGQEDLSFNQPVPVVDAKKGAPQSKPPVALASVSSAPPAAPPAPSPVPKSSPIEQRAVPSPMTPSPMTPPPAQVAPAAPPKPAPMPIAAPAPTPAPTPVRAPTPAPIAAKAAFESGSGSGISIGFSGAEGKYSPGMTTEIIADVFMRAMEIYDYGEDRHAAMKFTLDLATDHVSATGGAVLLTDINSPNQELWFEVASGPKDKELVNFRIPMGRGIVGFCAQEGVSLLIPSASQDPRFESDIMKDVGLSPGSVLCAPIQHNKRMLGAIMLYNKPDERPFTQGELSIVNYLAHTAGEYLIRLI